jgi:hypothetical protein
MRVVKSFVFDRKPGVGKDCADASKKRVLRNTATGGNRDHHVNK